MEKNYRRTPDIYIIVLIVGLIVVIDSFRIENFAWLYDGIKFLIALLVALYGLWGLLVPYAALTGNKLRINATIFKTKEFDLEKDTTIDFDQRLDTIEIKDTHKSHLVSTRNISKNARGQFKTDLKEHTQGKKTEDQQKENQEE
ncbi:MAG: hypothetical protein KGY70_11030 [Bacteroidales bacterium]|nr:hypothetical protein [Bacteroidales bacterium]